jgi:hypothetical protein
MEGLEIGLAIGFVCGLSSAVVVLTRMKRFRLTSMKRLEYAAGVGAAAPVAPFALLGTAFAPALWWLFLFTVAACLAFGHLYVRTLWWTYHVADIERDAPP